MGLGGAYTAVAEDGAEIWELVRACKPLDEESMYCNMIQCDHLRETCVVAERDGAIVGWVSAYVLPYDPETLFVWQVAVAEAAREDGIPLRGYVSMVTDCPFDGPTDPG